ncbi:unnamed protein product [Cuscuta epithymum]|uniref:Ubiquitin carboxyl-terminal hydrolase n=1 Tax=Cuscuta epithymum TaxID=186058 RepID=A0AAV0CB84_9ASTE|nr:unnamed protein product [Cuscuta epithymum]
MESSLDKLAAGDSDQIWCTPFHRRIEFHLARKPFNGFGNGCGGFHLETLNPSSKSDSVTVTTLGPGNPQLKKNSRDFDPELSLDMTFRKIMRIGAGLQNLGNTCYLNAVLQCLTYTEPLAAYLESGKHQTSCRKAGFCALCSIQRHVTHALKATGRILAPKDLVSNLRCISRNFRNARQEDAHEYMVNLLESMHKCCLPSGIPSESPSAYERSLVHRIFGGRLRSRVKCMQCSYCSDKLDPFLDISLEIVKADSLYKAFERFTAQELLDGGDKQYSCHQCKQKVKACKQLTIDKAPHVLTIHLKRFGSHLTGQKIVKKIHYGPVLDLNRFMSSPHTGDLKYTLYGVLVHAGWSTHSGHYYCFVRTSSGMWYSLDDNQVIQVNEKKVLDQKAYMLFYVRDRKSNLPKTHVDVVHKDIGLINGIRNLDLDHECDLTKGTSIHKGTLNTSSKDNPAPALPSLESSSLVAPPRDISKEPIGKHPVPGICSPLSHTLGNRSDGSHGTDSLSIVQTATKPSDCHTNDRMKDINTPMPLLSQWNSPKNTGMGKESSDYIPLPLSCSKDDVRGNDLNDIPTHRPEGGSGVANVCTQEKSILEKIPGLSQEDVNKPANCVTTKSLPLHGKAYLKVRKRPFKSHLASLIFSSALCPLRKRKHELMKCGISHKNLKGHRDAGRVKRKITLETPKKQSGDIDTALLTDKQHVKSSSSTSSGNKSENVESIGLKDLNQSGLMNMLTRGLEETRVASWDGIESFLEIRGARNEHANIGYVGDEWDEQYDQGKRKKIKSSKLDFGGPNPFQEIASKKAQFKTKKAKLDHCSYANQPFRI